MTDPILLTVLLPVRDETMNLRVMLRILGSVLACPHEILVVFDSEADESAPVVEEMRTKLPQVRPVINRTGWASPAQSAPVSKRRRASAF